MKTYVKYIGLFILSKNEEGTMIRWLKKLMNRYISYDIVGEYYESDEIGHYVRKFKHKYRLKKRRKP